MPADDRFCPSCASPLEEKDVDGHLRPVCTECGRTIFYDPKVSAICIVERGDKLLLVKRGNEPGYGLWSLPGGYVDRGEVVEAAAAREVWEETGLTVEINRLVGLFSESGNPVMVAAFAAKETGGLLTTGPETLDLGFFSLDDLPPLAFPRDEQIWARWRDLRDVG
jgi:ADP-ribose pyrophosphatase YjhB (NUDIX family)